MLQFLRKSASALAAFCLGLLCLFALLEAGLIETVMLQSKGRPAQWIKVL